jgi:hypothetical protein
MKWRNYASQTIISHIEYDGPADTHMPFLWKKPPLVEYYENRKKATA